VSPILTRPVREQLEHDRVIRQLQAKYKRKTDVVINPGNEQNQSVTVGELVVFPDLLVFAEGGRRLLVTVEVETGESVNSIEARAEWGVYTKLKVPLHLYVPPASVDAVRRLCTEYQIVVAELWTYTTSFDQVRFTMVHRDAEAPVVRIPERVATAPAPTLRQAQGRPERSRGTKVSPRAAKPVAKPAAKKAAKKPAPAKTKPKAKSKPAAKKAKPAPKAKPKKGATKRR
jgi:hypothetical protein